MTWKNGIGQIGSFASGRKPERKAGLRRSCGLTAGYEPLAIGNYGGARSRGPKTRQISADSGEEYLDGLLHLDDPRERGRRLTADLSGYWRFRIGDYRLIVELHDDILVLIAVGLGNWSEIYRKG